MTAVAEQIMQEGIIVELGDPAAKTMDNLDAVQMDILERRYLARDEDGNITETPNELALRVANAIAEAETDPHLKIIMADAFYTMIHNLDFLPNTPCLVNAGRKLGALAACFVVPVGDSIDAIFDAIKWTAKIQKGGGGTGFSFGNLRPIGSIVSTTGHIASGPISFMSVFNAATAALKQGGVRRGANMGILPCFHPCIEEFIDCKTIEGVMAEFNLSVGITDEFMEAVIANETFDLEFNGTIHKTIMARNLMQKIVSNAWRNGEPGVVFLDTMNKHNHLMELRGPIEATNPCAEQNLHPFDSCTLGSINLSKFTINDFGAISFDSARFRTVIRTAVRFLDNVIDVNNYPIPQIEKTTKESRRIGLGVMGLADLLRKLEIEYGSDECESLCEQIMSELYMHARIMSEELTVEKGSFPVWDESDLCKVGIAKPRRNINLTTVAPTGSISFIAGCSQGIEPFFAAETEHNVMNTKLTRKVSGKKNYKIASEISLEEHIKVQAAFQKHNDSGVSKSINMPNSATEDDVEKAFMLAWKSGCNGITVYRDGSREVQVLNDAAATNDKLKPAPKQSDLPARKYDLKVGAGNLSVFLVCDKAGEKLQETWISLGESGSVVR